MIEISDSLKLAIQDNEGAPVRLIDSSTNQTFLLLRAEDYNYLHDRDYDAGPWTDVEMDLLAAENADLLGWDEMEVYQDDAS